MNSIFQGSVDIRNVIAETLGLSTDDKNKYDYTYPIYHTAFFYLQKRFGVSKNYDEDKEAGRWILEFKGVQFLFSFHSDVVEIWVLGSEKDYLSYVSTPFQRAYVRALKANICLEDPACQEDKANLLKKHCKYTVKQYIEFEDKYGRCNSHHRYLLRVLKKLLKAFMREPIWVRDVPFNIKGRMDMNDVKRDYLDIKLVKK